MPKKLNLFDNLSRESLLAVIEHQRERIAALEAQNATLETRVEKLEARLAKNSTNSSKPPSSDGLKKPKPKSRREKGKRKNGGQVGHEGKTLEMVATPDGIVRHALGVCPDCQADLSPLEPMRVIKRQVFDIPPIRLQVTEHQAEVKVCPCCEHQSRAEFPDNVKALVQYGANVLAHAAYLNSYHLIPLARVREWFADCVGQAVSEATIEKAVNRLADEVSPALAAKDRRADKVQAKALRKTTLNIQG